MSAIKFSKNMFLDVNELNKFKFFIAEDGYKKILKNIINSTGIVKDLNNTNFKTTIKPNSGNVIIVNPGLAFDNNLDAISLNEQVELTINNTGIKQWLILSRSVSNLETGTVSISEDGTLIGASTDFDKILRGKENFPTKIKLESDINTDEYEVVSVISNDYAILSGESFTPESNLKYSVIGTFTPGFIPSEDSKKIYEYDYYDLKIISSEFKPKIEDGEFILSSIYFNELGAMFINDERYNYIFNENKKTLIQNGNNITSLLVANSVSGINSENTISTDFELIIEHGYKINQHELIINSNFNIINILSGFCNFLQDGDIPDGMFNGWILLNRKNMLYSIIDYNINKAIYVSNLDSSLIEENDNDIVVIPNAEEIEFEIKVSSNVAKSDIPFYFKESIWNVNSRIRFYAFFKNVSETFQDNILIKIKQRFLGKDLKQNIFSNLVIAPFINVKGQSEILSESSFNVNISELEPQKEQRNYS